MYDYLSHEEATKATKVSLKWQRNVMAVKCFFFVVTSVAILTYTFRSVL